MSYTPRYTTNRAHDEVEHFHMMYGGIGIPRLVLGRRSDSKIFARSYNLWRGTDIPKDEDRPQEELRHLPTSVKMRKRVIHDRAVYQVTSRDLAKNASVIKDSYKNHGVILVHKGPSWSDEYGLEQAILLADNTFFIHFPFARYQGETKEQDDES